MHGQSAPLQGQAGPSWQDGADMWISASTVVRFLGRVLAEEDLFGNQATAVDSCLKWTHNEWVTTSGQDETFSGANLFGHRRTKPHGSDL
jgi:hypothetical protein